MLSFYIRQTKHQFVWWIFATYNIHFISHLLIMRKLFPPLVFLLLMVLASCSSDSEDGNGNNGGALSLEEVLINCIDHTIIPQNAKTAQYADSVYNSIIALEHGRYTQEQIDHTAKLFLAMRLAYEQNEGFFLGANTNYNIDTDINNWPLDHLAFDQLMTSQRSLASLEGNSSSVVGFHALEYIFFRDGHIRRFSAITERELTYAKTLIGHLRLKLFQAECGWSGDDSKGHVTLLKRNGVPYLAPDGTTYRSYMLARYTTKQLAAALITGDHGLVGEADEIAYTKLLRPFSSDSTYIESPYSQTSLADLECNLRSICSVWYGNTDGLTRQGKVSFDAYFQKNNQTLATRVEQQLQKCDNALHKIPTPFVNHCHDNSVKEASDEFIALSAVLNEAGDYIQSH